MTWVTRRLLLTPVALADVEALWRIWTDPDVRRFLWDDEEICREKAEQTVRDCMALQDQGLGLWTLRLQGGPEVIGCAGLMPVSVAAEFIPDLRDALEPLVALSPAFQRQGLAGEALRALIDHAFGALHRSSLAAVVDLPNHASHRLVERAGFQCEGEADAPRRRLRWYRLLAPR